jgi:succinyl-CoA synthetase alpha subunit
MRVSEGLSDLNGVVQAIVIMGTDANKRVMTEIGLLTDAVEQAGPNDLVIVIEALSDETAQEALEKAQVMLSDKAEGAQPKQKEEVPFRTLEQAYRSFSEANMTLISVPGPFAKIEAAKALHAGMHVFMFSDNVPLEEELALKEMAVSKSLLMMGPDCGTAIINGVALAFANVVRRGPIGVVAAAGTALQEVTSLIDRGGVGISQAIGVGGRDLSEKIGGLMMRQGIAMLAADLETDVIVLISKPPAPSVKEMVLEAAKASNKPVIINFLSSKQSGTKNGLVFTQTLEDTARTALRKVRGDEQSFFDMDQSELEQLASVERSQLASGQLYLRGLFSGGSLCDEAMEIFEEKISGVYSNIPLAPEWALADAWQSHEHTCIDMGEDEFTQGRPHPMIDPRLRQERILKEADDPSVAVIFLDVVIGYGSHPNPAGSLSENIQIAKTRAADHGRYLSVVTHVCGTDQDPQGLQQQENILREAGALVLPTNAQAARVATAIVS